MAESSTSLPVSADIATYKNPVQPSKVVAASSSEM